MGLTAGTGAESNPAAGGQPAGLAIQLANLVLPKGERLACTVTTTTSRSERFQVELTVSDTQGRILARQICWTGESAAISLPEGFTGVCLVQARGTGQYLGLGSLAEVSLVGEAEQIARDLAAYARQVAAKLPMSSNGEDVAATLAFLADKLEGKVPSTFSGRGPGLGAFQAVTELCRLAQSQPWQAGCRRGMHQWAYRSAIDGSCQPYYLYLPEQYDPSRKYGLVIALHGSGDEGYRMVMELGQLCHPEDFIVVAPYGRGNMSYRTLGEQDVLDVMDLVTRTYSVDPDRICLVGTSMGGGGVWRLGQLLTDRFAAAASYDGYTGQRYLDNLRNLPMLVAHGSVDPTVPVDLDRAAVARLRELGYAVQYEELPNVGHNAWGVLTQQGGGQKVLAYLRSYQRNPWPERIDLTVSYLRYGRQYWVCLEELLKPLEPGYIGAEVLDARHIRIKTGNVAAFALDLRHPKLLQTGEVLLEVNGVILPVAAGQARVLLVESQGRYKPVQDIPLKTAPHLGGGLADLVYGPLCIVYGTARNGRTDLLRRAAERLADWSPNGQIRLGAAIGRFPIKPDTAVSATDLQESNLILLGAPEENRLTAQLAAKLPIRLNQDGVELQGRMFAGAGLCLVCPNPLAPSRLIGLVALPFDGDRMMQFAERTVRAFCLFNTREEAVEAYLTPDVTVLGPGDEILWRGCFDRYWERLVPVQP